jgi:hypothetical protein
MFFAMSARRWDEYVEFLTVRRGFLWRVFSADGAFFGGGEVLNEAGRSNRLIPITPRGPDLMAKTFQTLIATFFTPVKGVLAVLVLTVAVALSSETDASYQPCNCCSCSGFPFPGWPSPTYPPYVPPTPVVPPSASMPAVIPGVSVTKVGSPIWKPTDFQLFTAPAEGDAFFDTIDLLLPLEGPGAPVPYTPHAGPYDQELSTNAAAAGFVNQTIFPKSAITLNPNGVYFSYMLVPDPGITGSSRDFASGPVIPNSLFPFTTKAEMFLDNVLVETLQDSTFNPRAGDLPHTGASHRSPLQAVWYPWANDPNAGPLGSHEIRWSLRDNQNFGWDMVAAFAVVPEPSSLAVGAVGLTGIVAFLRRRVSASKLSR